MYSIVTDRNGRYLKSGETPISSQTACLLLNQKDQMLANKEVIIAGLEKLIDELRDELKASKDHI